MDECVRHRKLFRLVYQLVRWPVKALFGYTCANDALTEPTLVISNHVTDVDFLFLMIGLQGSHMYYVASEHLMRLGWLSKVIRWAAAPIARRKGTTAMDTAMTMMRKLRAGHSVCVFGEGETTWNGQSIPIYPATATLAKVSGKPMKTFRIEGGHLTMPRWGKGIRRGRVHGHVVNTYSPEQLKNMTTEQINDAINRDLYEDAWERQKQHPVRYRSRKRAEGIETVLFLCPQCRRMGTLKGKGHRVSCNCGYTADMTEYGTFAQAAPFENIAEWDAWQLECLRKGDYDAASRFCDEGMTLYRLTQEGEKQELAQGMLMLKNDALWLADQCFALKDINGLALIQKRILVFTCSDVYYEIRADQLCCLRKYLAAWKNCHNQNERET